MGIEDYIKLCCNELGVKPIKTLYNKKIGDEVLKLESDNERNPSFIRLIPDATANLETLFLLSHELRRYYQNQKNSPLYREYKDKEQFDNETDFYMQEGEIDANAYAAYMMKKHFKVNPIFDNQPDKAVKAINQRLITFLKSDR